MRIAQPTPTAATSSSTNEQQQNGIAEAPASPQSPSLTTISKGFARRPSLSGNTPINPSQLSPPIPSDMPNNITNKQQQPLSPQVAGRRRVSGSILSGSLFTNPDPSKAQPQPPNQELLPPPEQQQEQPEPLQPASTPEQQKRGRNNLVITKLTEQLDPTKLVTRLQQSAAETEKIGLTKDILMDNNSGESAPAAMAMANGRKALAVVDPKVLQGVQLKSLAEQLKMQCPECDCRQYSKSPFKNQCSNCFHTH